MDELERLPVPSGGVPDTTSGNQHDQEFQTAARDGVWEATGDDTPWISPEDASAHGANPEEQEAVDAAEIHPYGDIVSADDVLDLRTEEEAAAALEETFFEP